MSGGRLERAGIRSTMLAIFAMLALASCKTVISRESAGDPFCDFFTGGRAFGERPAFCFDWVARQKMAAGDFDAAFAEMRVAVGQARHSGAGRASEELRVELARMMISADRLDAAEAELLAVIADNKAGGNVQATAAALEVLAGLQARTGRRAARVASLTEALEMRDRSGERRRNTALATALLLGESLVADDPTAAQRHFERVYAETEGDREAAALRIRSAMQLAALAQAAGRLDDADRYLDEAERLAGRDVVSPAGQVADIKIVRAQASAMAGDLATADRLIADVVNSHNGNRSGAFRYRRFWALTDTARILWFMGYSGAAREILQRVAAESEAVAARAERINESRYGEPSAAAHVMLGWMAVDDGDPVAAEGWFRNALAALRDDERRLPARHVSFYEQPWRYRATALTGLGQALVRQHRLPEAREVLHRAAAIAVEDKGSGVAALAEVLLAKAGGEQKIGQIAVKHWRSAVGSGLNSDDAAELARAMLELAHGIEPTSPAMAAGFATAALTANRRSGSGAVFVEAHRTLARYFETMDPARAQKHREAADNAERRLAGRAARRIDIAWPPMPTPEG